MIKFSLLLLFVGFSAIASFAINVPRTPGSQSNTVRSGSSASWINVAQVTANDNNYATTNNRLAGNNEFTDFLDLSDFSFSIPSTSIITGITVTVARRTNGGISLVDEQIQLLIGGAVGGQNKANPLNWTTTKSTVSYGSNNDLWSTVLTSTLVNASNFGLRIAVQRNTGAFSSNQLPEIDFVQMTVSYNSTLPVELISFSAEALTNGDRKLNWSTATEINSAKYYIQRADPSGEFKFISEMRAAGNSQNQLDYTYIDREPNREAILYYRLIQEDLDGTQEAFDIVSVSPILSAAFSLFPNPASYEIHLKLKAESIPDIQAIQLYSLTGNLMGEFTLEKGLSFDISNYPRGSYLLIIQYKNTSETEFHKFIKT